MALRILMVEDDVLTREALSRVLRRRGHKVTAVGSVQEGRAGMALQPDVLLLDRNVHNEIGWDLKDEAPSTTRVVLMSGMAPLGSPRYWMKATDYDDLFEMIEGGA